MAEEKRTTQKGNMTINLFLWILSSSKTTRIPRFYRSAVLQVHLQMLTERRTPFPPPGPKSGDTRICVPSPESAPLDFHRLSTGTRAPCEHCEDTI